MSSYFRGAASGVRINSECTMLELLNLMALEGFIVKEQPQPVAPPIVTTWGISTDVVSGKSVIKAVCSGCQQTYATWPRGSVVDFNPKPFVHCKTEEVPYEICSQYFNLVRNQEIATMYPENAEAKREAAKEAATDRSKVYIPGL